MPGVRRVTLAHARLSQSEHVLSPFDFVLEQAMEKFLLAQIVVVNDANGRLSRLASRAQVSRDWRPGEFGVR